jgi:predicted DNA-binding transcriptional regulator AlpA
MNAGAFPRALKIPGRAGKTLVWQATEIARHIALRVQEADEV